MKPIADSTAIPNGTDFGVRSLQLYKESLTVANDLLMITMEKATIPVE